VTITANLPRFDPHTSQSVKWLNTGWTVRGSSTSRSKRISLLLTFQISEVHPEFCYTSTASPSRVQNGRTLMLTAHRLKTEWSYTSTPRTCLHGLHTDKGTFSLYLWNISRDVQHFTNLFGNFRSAVKVVCCSINVTIVTTLYQLIWSFRLTNYSYEVAISHSVCQLRIITTTLLFFHFRFSLHFSPAMQGSHQL
jgi:hypothetical protein